MDIKASFEVLRLCKLYVWTDKDFNSLTDELKKDFALSLFIQTSKDATTDKIQRFKRQNIQEVRG